MMIKVCGITRAEDAVTAATHGATALGFIFWAKSPRYIEPERVAALVKDVPEGVARIGVFVNEDVARVREIVDLLPKARIYNATGCSIIPGFIDACAEARNRTDAGSAEPACWMRSRSRGATSCHAAASRAAA